MATPQWKTPPQQPLIAPTQSWQNIVILINSGMAVAIWIFVIVWFSTWLDMPPTATTTSSTSAATRFSPERNVFRFTLQQQMGWTKYPLKSRGFNFEATTAYQVCCKLLDGSLFFCSYGRGWTQNIGMEAIIRNDGSVDGPYLAINTRYNINGSFCKLVWTEDD
jgi:hypothetical protein